MRMRSLNLAGRRGSEGDAYAALAGGVEGGGPGFGAVGLVVLAFFLLHFFFLRFHGTSGG